MAHKDRKSAYEDKDLTDAKWMVEGVIADGYDLEAILKEYGGGAANLLKKSAEETADTPAGTQSAEEALPEPVVEEPEEAEPAQAQEAAAEEPAEEEPPHPKRVLFPGRFAAPSEEPESPEAPEEEDGGEPPPPPEPSVEELVKNNPSAAVMMEMVQGEGGVHALSTEFVKGVESLCREHDLCLIVDEVQTGNGRTGKLYAYMHHGITPDIVTTAKGLGGGLPIGACLLGERVETILGPGMHGSTFGGNPAVCAGAVNILSRIDDALLAGVEERAAYIRKELASASGVKSVSGLGLMIGVETEKDAKELLAALMARGVLVLTAKTKLRLLPPLNIPMALLEKAVAIIKEELAK